MNRKDRIQNSVIASYLIHDEDAIQDNVITMLHDDMSTQDMRDMKRAIKEVKIALKALKITWKV